MPVGLQVELGYRLIDKLMKARFRNALDSRVVEHVIFYRHFIEDGVGLGTVADVLPDLTEVLCYVHTVDFNNAT